jgi:hypothetical protein
VAKDTILFRSSNPEFYTPVTKLRSSFSGILGKVSSKSGNMHGILCFAGLFSALVGFELQPGCALSCGWLALEQK